MVETTDGARIARRLWKRVRVGVRAMRWRLRIDGTDPLLIWPLAIAIGIAAGYAALLFRIGVGELQTLFYGTSDPQIHSAAASLPWPIVLVLPICGGLVVGLVLHGVMPGRAPHAVADVIEAAALRGGKVERRPGLASTFAALVTLSTGGSTGREGPAVHLGAVIASWVSDRLKMPEISARDILGCAAAAAVSASFNAPIAGALFALEVVLRHYAVHAFGPIVLSSVTGAVVARLHLGDVTEYTLPAHTLAFYWELPAFLILGVLCGLVAVVLIRSVFFAETVADKVQAATGVPNWLRPACAGCLLGAIAILFPHIIGVGYETTSLALTSQIPFWFLVSFAVVKVAAVAITLAGRMGGGIFSPALMLGALTGAAFGDVAVEIFPSVSGSEGLYALAGMGAVAGAVLGAPISTILIVFELTGDWQAGIAVMITVAIATVVTTRLVHKSFFLTQIQRRGYRLAAGPQAYLAATLQVAAFMRPRGAEDGASDSACQSLMEQRVMLERDDTLEEALGMFERLKGPFLPVVVFTGEDEPELIGALFQTDALRAYTRALEEVHREEHG